MFLCLVVGVRLPAEYKVEAAHRVIDGDRRVAEVAGELDLHENLLHSWVRDERRRMAAAGGGARPDSGGGEPLSSDERAELVRLRARVNEQAKEAPLPCSHNGLNGKSELS
jgi:transposase